MLYRTVKRYRFDDKLFNLRRLQAKSKVQPDVLDELLYFDECKYMTKCASSEKMQEAIDRVSQAYSNYEIKISTKKTDVVYQRALGKPYSEPTIMNGQRLRCR